MTRTTLLVAAAASTMLASAAAAQSFVNWETPPVSPLALSPDGSVLAVANLADARVDFFVPGGATPTRAGSVAVGLDPVTVRFRSATELWAVNHVSDTITVIDVPSRRAIATIATLDEPCDVVFAGTPSRAYVSCSQANVVQVFDAGTRTETARIAVNGEEPRSLAVSPDGEEVYVAIFESGNATTILGGGIDPAFAGTLNFPPNVVSEPESPYAGANPPPNSGASFVPPQAPGNRAAPRVGHIVRKNGLGQWIDDNGGDWTQWVSGPRAEESGRVVGWDMPDRDIAIIDVATGAVRYATGLMNIVMDLEPNPATGQILAVGTEATNEVRFEPNLRGKFVRTQRALVDPLTLGKTLGDMNPHLGDYSDVERPLADRRRSLGDPRAIAWRADGSLGFVAGMGSGNVVVVNSDGTRASGTDTIAVGAGPIGLAVDDARGLLYTFNRFDASLSVVDIATRTEIARVPVHDATPAPIRTGRRHLYDTVHSSGTGHLSCASCHVDARVDRLSWDLGVPNGPMLGISGASHNLGAGIPILGFGFTDFHPMKGPMLTQTLQDIIGHEPLHWRGDRTGLEPFNSTFPDLMARASTLTAAEMQELEDFLATIAYPPNPYRNTDNTLPTNLPLPGHFSTGRFSPAGTPLPNGNAARALDVYRSTARNVDRGAFSCATCHTLPTGMGTPYRWNGNAFALVPPGPEGEFQSMMVAVDGSTQRHFKVPSLRNLQERTGTSFLTAESRHGFGFLHDGSVDSIERFVSEPAFSLADDQEIADMVAFMLAFAGSDLPVEGTGNQALPPGAPSKDTHAAVGRQSTIASPAGSPLIDSLLFIASQPDARISIVVKAHIAGLERGFAFDRATGTFRSDIDGEPGLTPAELLSLAAPGWEQTWTAVPAGSQVRLGTDRDGDGFGDRTETLAGSDPADALSVPRAVSGSSIEVR
jgi:YVTN family beta-propeller protein